MSSYSAAEHIIPPAERADQVVDVLQIVYALERCERRLRLEAEALSSQGDYSAEFPAEDADRVREAIALLTAKPLRP
jgi:hypothetical protein